MKRKAYNILILLTAILLMACKKDGSSDNQGIINDYDNITKYSTPTPSPVNEEKNATEITREGHLRSFITGEWIPEDIAVKRPYAIQFSNFKSVSSQAGIGQAGIVYEAIVEGGITRLLAITDTLTSERIGSIRSTRHYFISIADEYDSIFIHFGKTKYAVAKLKETGTNNLDGETGIGTTVFYRDNQLKAPHNAFTSIDRIQAGVEKKKFRTEYNEGYKPHFNFYYEDTDLLSESIANIVTVKFSSYISPIFEYNSTDQLYYRYQFGGPHVDLNTGEQLTFKNIIVQFVNQYPIDRNDYQTIDFENSSGTGYYITNGKMVPITWKKNEKQKWMRYYNQAGEELTINPGKTFIAIFPENRTKDVIIDNRN